MGICNDRWILRQCEFNEMISPFERELVREVDGQKVLSYGLGSYGYDIRLSPSQFLVHRYTGNTVDPKDVGLQFESQPLIDRPHGKAFVLPANSFGLGVSVERFKIPKNVCATATGKSTLARNGIQINITPLEAGWRGFLTIEVINNGQDDILVYANEGIAQLLFFEGEPCRVSYECRQGKYQDQDALPVRGIL